MNLDAKSVRCIDWDVTCFAGRASESRILLKTPPFSHAICFMSGSSLLPKEYVKMRT